MTELRPPAELAYLTDIIGLDATLRLIETAGGTRIYLARDLNQGSKLAIDIGWDAARLLTDAFKGEPLKVPLCRWWRARYYRQVLGLTYAACALRLGCTETTVWRLLRTTQGAEQQTELLV
jgi:hypothetical protein